MAEPESPGDLPGSFMKMIFEMDLEDQFPKRVEGVLGYPKVWMGGEIMKQTQRKRTNLVCLDQREI